jgi:hypothetical protein
VKQPWSVRAIVEAQQFRAGFEWGLVGLALVLAAAGAGLVLSPRRWPRLLPVAGLALAGAAALALDRHWTVPAGVWAGLALLAVGGTIGFRVGPKIARPALAGLLALPGGLILGATDPLTGTGFASARPAWSVPLITLTACLGGAAVAAFDARDTRALGPPAAAVTCFGVYATVPDTEQALALLGAGLVLGTCGWPTRIARLGPGGSFAFAGILAWVAVAGGIGRDASMIGACASLGVLVAEPAARLLVRPGLLVRLARMPANGRRGWMTIAVLALHTVTVLVTARVAGLRSQVIVAAVIAVAALGAAAFGCAALARTLFTDQENPGNPGKSEARPARRS